MKPRKNFYQGMAGHSSARLVRSIIAAVLAATVMAGCASTGGGPGSGSSVVDRAEKRWAALLAGDYATAYNYYSPGFRSSQSVSDFELAMRLRKVQFSEVAYQSQQCDENRCDLKFEVGYRAASPVPGIDVWKGKASLDETWIRTDGQWWYLPDN